MCISLPSVAGLIEEMFKSILVVLQGGDRFSLQYLEW